MKKLILLSLLIAVMALVSVIRVSSFRELSPQVSMAKAVNTETSVERRFHPACGIRIASVYDSYAGGLDFRDKEGY